MSVKAGHGIVATALALLAAAALAGAARAQSAPEGIDVSNWQGRIDWVKVAGAGYDFAFAKATEGTTFDDATYPLNRSGAGAVGVRVGAYHFARPSGSSDAAAVASAVAQAEHFVGYAQPARGDLLPVLDLETRGGLSTARLQLWTRAWLDHVVARLGVRPLVYVSPSFWKTAVGDTPVFAQAGHRLWIAHWTKASLPILPGAGWGGLGWTFWQWTDCTKVPGILNCVDGDRHNGPELGASTIAAFPGGAPVAGSPATIVGTPQVGKLLAALPGAWGGGKPATFGYQWQRCDAAGAACVPIAGAARQTYTPTAADAGHALGVVVTARTAAGSAAVASAPTLAVASSGAGAASAPRASSPPAVEGELRVGRTLTALAGVWSGSPTSFAYQWRRCDAAGGACAAIAGAGSRTYALTPDDAGATLSLVVTATGRGGSSSATAPVTAAVEPAPLPEPSLGTAVARPGEAGAIVSSGGAATVSWQPGAVPAGAAVALSPVAGKLPLDGTAVRLSTSASGQLRWPVDVRWASAPADAVPGLLPGRGVWRAVAELPSPVLPPGQDAGAYRDGSGFLHVLTRRPGRLALFAAGKWGDPRFATSSRPKLATVTEPRSRRLRDGSVILLGRITLDAQAHLYASVAAGGRRLVLSPRGSRLPWWLAGRQAKTLQALQLRPGALPFRIRIPRSQAKAPVFELRLAAVDPYGRRGRLSARVAAPR